MKHLIIIVSLLFSANAVFAQSLIDIYKKGTIKLVPDTEYGQGNDWEKVFATYYDTLYNRPMGERKSIILMPDGSAVVNHAYRNYYSKFDPTGKFVKEFGVTNSSGKQFQKVNGIEGVLNNTFFTGLDNMGKMLCFDFNGKYVKSLKLDYMTKGMIPLSDNKFAVVGWVIWKEKFRDFVSIVDYNTNQEKVIWEHFTERNELGEHKKLFNYSYKFKERGAFSCTTMPYSKYTGLASPPQIAYVKNKLIIALPATGEILAYDINGKLISKEKITWGKNEISVEEQKEIQKKAIAKYKEGNFIAANWVSREEMEIARQTIVQQMEDDLSKITVPIPIPAFSTIIKDSDNNLLFFEIPKENGDNKFNVWVYDNGGQFIGQSSFECDEYNLVINPSKMVFHKGYIYSLQTLKGAKGNPLRLVRFKLTNKQ